MALIIQARNSSNGGNTTELLRRQVAMLHLRFYVALFGAFLAFFYAGEKFRIPYNLALYSFWVPQIVLNVITEAKRPMHHYYIYGMSLTRLVAPLYIFAEPNNFLKEVYPESPTDYQLCQLLVLWVGFQTAVLIAQGKYGARFMIPARFLPPKFDYSRPIPPSLLPPGITQEIAPESPPHRDSEPPQSIQESQSLLPNDQVVLNRHTTGVTTRNRIKGSRARQETSMTTETVLNDTSAHAACHTIDCVICYNSIDVHNRRGYMLAPCDHIFHKDCLMEWMNVKMECPVCRTELPSI
jgi:Ring finger domain